MPSTPVLLLIEKDAEPRAESPKKYALLTKNRLSDRRVFEAFRRDGFQVVVDGQVKFSKNGRFDLIPAQIVRNDNILIAVDELHKDFVQRLFKKNVTVSAPCPARKLSNDDLLIIKSLLKSGSKINYKSADGSTILHFLTEKGPADVLKVLVQQVGDVNAKRKDSATALHIAAEQKDLRKVALLVEYGADVNAEMTDGSTPLILAVKGGCLNIVKLLIAKGANVNGIQMESKSLYTAAKNVCANIAKYLLSYVSFDFESRSDWRNFKSSIPLHVAVLSGYYEIVALLLTNGADINAELEDGTTSLHIAAANGHTETVKCLLRYDVNVDGKSDWSNFKSSTPLHLAVLNGYHEIAALLLKKGANVNAERSDGRTPLYLAISEDNLKVCEILVKFNLDVSNPNNKKAFKCALSKFDWCFRYREVTFLLLDYGFSIDAADARDPNLLLRAIGENSHQMVEKLLVLGANANVRRWDTPLHRAAKYADEDMIRLLLNHGADINAVNPLGRTPLSTAIRFSNGKIARALIANNASVKKPELLHSAVKDCSDPEVVELLLGHGVRVNSGKPPAIVTVKCENLEIFKVLVKFGASCGVRHLDSRFSGCLDVLKAFLNYDFTIFDCADVDTAISGCFSDFCECRKKVLGIVLLKMAVAYESDRFEAHLPTYLRNANLKKKYTAEIAKIKVRKIGLSSITFYDILTKNTSKVSKFLRNENFSQTLKNFDVSAAYPNYGPIIECQIQKGTWRRESLKKGVQLFGVLFREFSSLPGDVKEDLVDYLSNQDILILQHVLKSNRQKAAMLSEMKKNY